ncbi:hypothetical protein PN497_16995, partial [Sphaerospermopsis kisseleviana CS-549]|nr:hypothetical protein [Sphaerospermopsis kisseleviana CS-549]
HERITSWENPIDKAVWQLKQVCQELPSRPITLWDIEYGCAPFVIKTAEINADKKCAFFGISRDGKEIFQSPPDS